MRDQVYDRDSITIKARKIFPYYYVFRKTYKFLQKSQWWSRQQLEAYQLQKLRKLLKHAYENVPYYRKVFDKRGIKSDDVQSLSDLQKLPFLTNKILQDNINNLKATNYHQNKFEYAHTSGSTGTPVGFFYEKGVSRAVEWAFMKTQWDRVGYKFSDKCIYLRGSILETTKNGIFWKKELLGRWLIMSSFHMTEENLPKYIRKIREFKPKFIQAYPSSITILARYMKENNIDTFPSLKAILCGSENLYPWQRKLLDEVFQCRVYSWYGHAEQGVLAGECEESTYYHIFPEYGIVELIGKDNKLVTSEGKMGEVVTTNLNNYVFPLIRYRTVDLAVYRHKQCECGRAYPLFERVEGRLHEFLVGRNNRMIALSAINVYSDDFRVVVEQFQFHQKKPGEVILNIVKKPSYKPNDTEKILKELERKLGDDIQISIRFVDSIPRTKQGKYRFLTQELPIEANDLFKKEQT